MVRGRAPHQEAKSVNGRDTCLSNSESGFSIREDIDVKEVERGVCIRGTNRCTGLHNEWVWDEQQEEYE